MRYGFFSDIHSEAKRLEVVLKVLTQRGLDKDHLICVGDIIGEGNDADSNDCIAMVRESAVVGLRGNHDELALAIRPAYLTDKSFDYLMALRPEIRIGDMLVVHDHPLKEAQQGEGRWSHGSYIKSQEDADDVLQNTQNLCFKLLVGHNHLAKVFWEGDSFSLENGGTFRFHPKTRYIFSIGAVGYSRDGNPNPSCAIYDSEERTFEVLRPDVL